MFNWNAILDDEALATVLPGQYARFARPVREALAAFLDWLPAQHQAEILARQAGLPPSASVSQRLGALARSCPVLHKLGQVLARDQRLAPQLRWHLQQLESFPSTIPLVAIEQILHRELGSYELLGISLTPPAIAEASVAVVMPFVQRKPGLDEPQHGVFKVLKPGIQERLDLELALLERVGALLDRRCKSLGIPHLDYEELFGQIRDKLRQEIQLDQEQQHLLEAAHFYTCEPRIQIPALMPRLCTQRVTAMERVAGVKVTDHGLSSEAARRRLADLIVRGLIAAPIFSPAKQAMFHSDPHAGNLMLTDGGRLAILDWSLVGSLDRRQREAIIEIMLAAALVDAERILTILERLRIGKPARPAELAAIVTSAVNQVRRGHVPGMSWLIELLDEAVKKAGLRVATDLMLFRKSLHTLEGLLGDVAPGGYHIDDLLLADFGKELVLEWPRRCFAWADSRDFATHISNLDLTSAMLSLPAAMIRFWVGQNLPSVYACGATGNLQN